ncbi:MAG: Unknown protein [uncultured Campylobacterales bacterium]|uniref:TolC family protein n=1 Tax=uncultured Campylobacterales bacterium TaxID=352960 RepID=A0A6S6SFV4_9BACT|nr:MAG: Unknown protein [uncultured Campylobacterales bacterium]
MRNIIIFLLLLVNLKALTLDDAIKKALKNNTQIKSQGYLSQIAKENINISKSSFKPSLDVAYSKEQRKENLGFGKKESSSSASITYNVFNGFKDFYSLKSTKNLAYNEELNLKLKKLDIVYNTKVAFINYLKNKKNIATVTNAYELFEKQYQDAKNKFDEGLLAKNDLLQINVRKLEAKQNLALSKSNAKIAKYKLKNILGSSFDINEELEDVARNELLNEYNVSKLGEKLEIQVLETLKNSILNQKKSNRGDNYPTIDIGANYIKYHERTTSFSADLQDEQASLFLNIKWNLYGGNKQSYQDVKLSKQILQINEDLTQLKLDTDMMYQEAVDRLRVAELNYQTALISLDQAEENYSLVNSRLKEGLLRQSDQIDANYLLSEAKQNVDNAYYDIFLADALLQRLFERSY